jgi:hypothetical protein
MNDSMSGFADSRKTIRAQISNGPLHRADNSERFYSRVANFQGSKDTVNYQVSFSYLKSRLQAIRTANPGTTANLEVINVNGQRRFYRMVIALASDINLAACCKPVVSFDAGVLKHPSWSGWLVMVMGMQDGAGHDCIIALALVPEEDEDSYSYFIRVLLKNDTLQQVLNSDELVVITDRSKGLIGAIEKCLPNAHHRYCAMHLLGNIPRPSFSGQERKDYFRIVRAKTLIEYDQRMQVLKNTHEQAYTYLANIAPSLWVDYAQPRSSWGMCTNNLAERAIGSLGTDRNNGRTLCPLMFLNNFLDTQTKRYAKRVAELAGPRGVLTIAAESTFDIIYAHAQSLRVTKGTSRIEQGSVPEEDTTIEEFFVHRPIADSSRPTGYHTDTQTSERRCTVECTDGVRYTSTCAQGRSQGLPCQHVWAVAQQQKRARMMVNNMNYWVHECLTHLPLHLAYKARIDSAWGLSEDMTQTDIAGPPEKNLSKSMLGKRIASKSAIHSGVKSGKRLKRCSICRNLAGRGGGHYAKTCPLAASSQTDRDKYLADRAINTSNIPMGIVSNVIDLCNSSTDSDDDDDMSDLREDIETVV